MLPSQEIQTITRQPTESRGSPHPRRTLTSDTPRRTRWAGGLASSWWHGHGEDHPGTGGRWWPEKVYSHLRHLIGQIGWEDPNGVNR